MGKKQVVQSGQGFLVIMFSRSVFSIEIAEDRTAERFIQGNPSSNLRKKRKTMSGVFLKSVGSLPGRPASPFLTPPGQIPVIEGDHRLYTVLLQFTDQSSVILHPLHIYSTVFTGNYSGPGDTESVRMYTELFHEGDVSLIKV